MLWVAPKLLSRKGLQGAAHVIRAPRLSFWLIDLPRAAESENQKSSTSRKSLKRSEASSISENTLAKRRKPRYNFHLQLVLRFLIKVEFGNWRLLNFPLFANAGNLKVNLGKVLPL